MKAIAVRLGKKSVTKYHFEKDKHSLNRLSQSKFPRRVPIALPLSECTGNVVVSSCLSSHLAVDTLVNHKRMNTKKKAGMRSWNWSRSRHILAGAGAGVGAGAVGTFCLEPESEPEPPKKVPAPAPRRGKIIKN